LIKVHKISKDPDESIDTPTLKATVASKDATTPFPAA
jgi:hypothetical protein